MSAKERERADFFLQLLADYTLLNELSTGALNTYCLYKVGIKYGLRLEDAYRSRHLPQGENLSPEQFAELAHGFIKRLGGEYEVESCQRTKMVLRCRRCVFGLMTLKAPGLCHVITGVLGGIAARNFPYCKVTVEKKPDGGPFPDLCRLVFYLAETPEADAAGGRVFSCDPASYLLTREEILALDETELSGGYLYGKFFTAKKLLELEMMQMEKFSLVAELAAGIAHEIRNPMASLRGFLQLLRAEFSPGSRGYEYTKLMIQEIDRANSIIKEFLLLTRPAAPNLRETDLHQVLEDICLLVESKSLLENVSLEKNYQPGLLSVTGDPDQLKQVFLNLATNAIQAMPEGGTLSISTAVEKNKTYIKFRDTGCGINPSDREKIFYPFYTTKEQGTGLGLAVSYRIVAAHNGRILVDSLPDRGSAFTVELPLSCNR
jgi:signal transduction histidine kinase